MKALEKISKKEKLYIIILIPLNYPAN